MRAPGARFHALYLVFVGALVGMCFTAYLFNLFALFELANVSASALIAYRIEEAGPVQGGFNFLVIMGVAGAFALFGIALLYGHTGALDFALVGEVLAAKPLDDLTIVAFALLVVALLTKAGLMPFHFAHADAHASAPTAVLVLFSGVLLAEGLYLLTRIAHVVFPDLSPLSDGPVRSVFIAVGATTAVLAALLGYAQQQLKRLLAFSSIAHMGMALVGFGLADPIANAGASLALGMHALTVAALFLCVGVVLTRRGVLDEARLARRPSRYGPIALFFVAGGLAIAGPFPTGAFLAKAWIGHAARGAGLPFVAPLLAFASIVTAAAIFRVAARIFWGLEPPHPDALGPKDDPESEELPSPRPVAIWALYATIALLLLPSLALGACHGKLGGVIRAAAELGSGELYRSVRLGHGVVDVVVPQEPTVEPLVVATSFGSPLLALAIAALSIVHERLPRGLRRLTATLVEPVAALRRLHSGAIGDYVALFVLGAALFAGALVLGSLQRAGNEDEAGAGSAAGAGASGAGAAGAGSAGAPGEAGALGEGAALEGSAEAGSSSRRGAGVGVRPRSSVTSTTCLIASSVSVNSARGRFLTSD
jgi:multicomponent Na+:H+ antiporter subunit D